MAVDDAAEDSSSSSSFDEEEASGVDDDDDASAPPALSSSQLLSRIVYRPATPFDMPKCHALEASSYPTDEAASKSTLQYRQHHAAPFFRVAVLMDDEDDNDENGGEGGGGRGRSEEDEKRRGSGGGGNGGGGGNHQGVGVGVAAKVGRATLHRATSSASAPTGGGEGTTPPPPPSDKGTVVGFVCSTRCASFDRDSLSKHDASGRLLAVHSVVVDEPYRRLGLASDMIQNYVSTVRAMNRTLPPRSIGLLRGGLDKIVLMSKPDLLGLYVRNGFACTRPSPIVHGSELWYECELDVQPVRSRGLECFVVDAFADPEKPGSGNPAAVVLLEDDDGGWDAAVHLHQEGGGGGGTAGGAGDEAGGAEAAADACSVGSAGALSVGGSVGSGGALGAWNRDDRGGIISDDEGGEDASFGGAGWMRTVAKEFNLSETAFVWPLPPASASVSLPTTPASLGAFEGEGGEGGSTSMGAGADASGGGGGEGKGGNVSPPRYGIRYYTRTGAEVDLCGHATLAAAAVLFGKQDEVGGGGGGSSRRKGSTSETAEVVFHALNDVLRARRAPSKSPSSSSGGKPRPRPPGPAGGGGKGGASSSKSNKSPLSSNRRTVRIVMDFPRKTVTEATDATDKAAIVSMLSSAFYPGAVDVATPLPPDRIVHVGWTDDREDVFVELTREAFMALEDRKVQYDAFRSWNGYRRGVIMCCSNDGEYDDDDGYDDHSDDEEDVVNGGGDGGGGGSSDERGSRRGSSESSSFPAADVDERKVHFLSRFFGPKMGIDEDPVTGSAHCALGPYFAGKKTKDEIEVGGEVEASGGRGRPFITTRLVGRQVSERGGIVECLLKEKKTDSEGAKRISIAGTAITTVTGRLHLGS